MIPVIYIFQYDKEHLEKANRRLNSSIGSLINQDCNIYVINASDNLANRDFHPPRAYAGQEIKIVDVPYTVPFNKSKLINWAVKNLLANTNYFIVSDSDIVYPDDYIERMEAYVLGAVSKPVRVLPYNLGCDFEYYTSSFDELYNMMAALKPSLQNGYSDGCGLFHIPSFVQIRGFVEKYFEYGPESVDFNERVGTFNEIIRDDTIRQIHLWHEPNQRNYVEKNIELFKQIKQSHNIIINGNTWGEL